MLSAFQKGQSMREKQLSFGSERLPTAHAPAFLIKLHSQTLLQSQQAIANPLLGDMQNPRRLPQAPLARQFDKSCYLIGRQRWVGCGHRLTNEKFSGRLSKQSNLLLR